MLALPLLVLIALPTEQVHVPTGDFVVKLDLSMFNFSSYYENITQDNSLLGYGIEASSSAEGETEHGWVDQLFSFKHLKDLEAVFLDDSPAFLKNIR